MDAEIDAFLGSKSPKKPVDPLSYIKVCWIKFTLKARKLHFNVTFSLFYPKVNENFKFVSQPSSNDDYINKIRTRLEEDSVARKVSHVSIDCEQCLLSLRDIAIMERAKHASARDIIARDWTREEWWRGTNKKAIKYQKLNYNFPFLWLFATFLNCMGICFFDFVVVFDDVLLSFVYRKEKREEDGFWLSRWRHTKHRRWGNNGRLSVWKIFHITFFDGGFKPEELSKLTEKWNLFYGNLQFQVAFTESNLL